MNRLLLLLVLVTSATAAPVAFEPPMSLDGTGAAVEGTAFLVAFRPGTQWTLQVESDDVGKALRHRYVDVDMRPLAGVSYESQVEETPVPSDWSRLRLTSQGRMATLVVQADSIQAKAPTMEGRMSILEDSPSIHWDDPWWSDAIRQPMQLADGPLPALQVEEAPGKISFTGLRSIEWANAAVWCDGDECPQEQDSTGIEDYIQQSLSNGTATLTGTADFVAFLGPMDLSFHGTARFPRAVGSLDCPNCTVEVDTLTVHGAIRLRNVTATGGTLSADLTGAYSVRVGESSVGRVSGPAAALATVAALAGLALLAKLALALISKRIQEKPLEQLTRSGVFEAVVANPAITRAELMRLTGIKNGQMVHHERVLVETGQVRVWKRGRATHYAVPEVPRAEAMRRRAQEDPELAELVSFVAGQAGSSQGTVAQWAGERFGWSLSTVQERLHLLLDVGLLERERQGRMALYRVPESVLTP